MGKTQLRVFGAVLLFGVLVTLHQNCGVRHPAEDADQPSDTADETPPPAATTNLTFRAGKFNNLAAGTTAALAVTGGAQIVRDTIAKTTTVNLEVTGLTPATAYMAHVHAFPCAVNDAGGHYKIDPSVAVAQEANEIWPLFTTDATGVGMVSKTVAHLARGDAESVVVHGAAGEKLICADLADPSATAISGLNGRFKMTAAGTAAGANITGTAVLVRRPTGSTEVTANFRGAIAATAYTPHVHNLPCDVMVGGTHYMVDPTVATPVETNEIWPACTSDAAGTCRGVKTVAYVARPDAMSVMVHNPADGMKFACADLVEPGCFVETQTGLTRNIDITGRATMTRSSSGKTTVTVSVKGLPPSAGFMAHVHDRPCATGGGGHYKIDYAIAAAQQTNEIWLMLNSDAAGAATSTVTVDHAARVEAQSVVIHDPSDNGRLVCADLW